MRLIIRYLSPLFRSRRRFSFFAFISLLLCIAFILFLIDYNHSLSISRNNTENKLITKSISTTQNKGLWPIDKKGRSLKTRFLVLDLTGFFGSGASEGAQVQCSSSNTTFIWTRRQDRIEEIDFIISHDARNLNDALLSKIQLNNVKQQYTMAYVMESEVHSSTGDPWKMYNFKMTYNLDDSYPEPATYFDTNIHIIDLLKPPTISFEDKEPDADIVWIISNCNAHNGREDFIKELMKEIKIDSYGPCLNNRHGYEARMTDNVDAYMKYKFVIAIENSNCIDYVSEKLVKAVESGSIPIVAGRNNRPDYRRYMPEHSYINIFDYKSVKALADDLKRIANNQTLYESYLWFKNHKVNIDELPEYSLEEKLKHLANVIGSNATMITQGIAGKEKSENKVCKLIRFVRQTPWQTIAAHQGTPRADASIACLPNDHILTHFSVPSANISQTEQS